MAKSIEEVDPLALSMRPKHFSELIGQEQVVRQILNQYNTRRMPRAWLFHGHSGGGKTTTARILALALQEKEPKQFGELSPETIAEESSFAIHEINASETNGVEDMGKIAVNSTFTPPPGSRKRVFILDEAHRITPQAQNLLLKPTEDGPKSTVWIFCTTDPSKLLITLRRRCTVHCRFQPLTTDSIMKLALRAKKETGFDGKIKPFVDRMDALGESSPGIILNAFEAYITKASMPSTETDTDIDPISLCRVFLTGHWGNVARALKSSNNDQARELQIVLMGYLRSMLLGQHEKSKAISALILDLSRSPFLEGAPLMAWLSATLYTHIRNFK